MQEVILEAKVREKKGKSAAKAARHSGFIPAVVYAAGKESQVLELSRHDFLRFIHLHHVESTLVNLKIGGAESRTVIVKEVQYHPVKEDITHIDFQEISLTSKIKVNVGVKARGEPAGVKQEGGTLNHILWELEIECLPVQIPPEIEVDVAAMKIGDIVCIKDLTLPEGVRALGEPDSIVFSLEAPRKEEEPQAEAGEEEGAKPELEVIKEKKETDGEGAKEKEKGKEEKG